MMMRFTTDSNKSELSARVSGLYQGSLVMSDTPEPIDTRIAVDVLSEALVRITFEVEGHTISLRAILSEESGDIYMIIQEKVTDDYILKGVRGFVCKRPNIHGGFISQLQGIYFHVLFNHFSGQYREFCFFGKPVDVPAIAV